MSYSEYIIEDNDDPVWSADPAVSVSCALPDLRYIVYAALGAAIVAAALTLFAVRKLRPW